MTKDNPIALVINSDAKLLSEKQAIAELTGVPFGCETCKNFILDRINLTTKECIGRCSMDPFTTMSGHSVCDSWEMKNG